MSERLERRKRGRGAGEEPAATEAAGPRRVAPPAAAAKRSRLAPQHGERRRREGEEGEEAEAEAEAQAEAQAQAQGRGRQELRAWADDGDALGLPAAAAAAAAYEQPPPLQECGICLEAILGERGVLDSCAHLFCYTCIDRWLARSCRCPFCKRVVTTLSSARATGLVAAPVPVLACSPASATLATASAHARFPGIASQGTSSSLSGLVPARSFGPAHVGCATPPRMVKRVAQRELRETLQREDDEDSEEDIHDLLDQISVVARTLGLRFTYRQRTVLGGAGGVGGAGTGSSPATGPLSPDSISACEPGSDGRLSNLMVGQPAGLFSAFSFGDLLVNDSSTAPARYNQPQLQHEPIKYQLQAQDGAALAVAIEQLEKEPDDKLGELFPASLSGVFSSSSSSSFSSSSSSSSSSFFSSSSSSSSAALLPSARSQAAASARLSPEELLLASLLSGANLPSQRRRADRSADPRKDAGSTCCSSPNSDDDAAAAAKLEL